ncbi:Uncharacterised protein [Mycobacterium tuberculosis]|uniref:Uncharacterized protein n=2 Tax=Mycobacterium tuberculosis TaxID=1773 RepID=A0A916L9D6_MYCTX|nr:Uncharacterised protein [Mycobacterium tuberculosis]COX44095.1 Uncharacterised protein [Mycobacterium tuberculosis]
MMMTKGNATNSTRPNTDVNHGPRNGLRNRVSRCNAGGGCRCSQRHSPAGKP